MNFIKIVSLFNSQNRFYDFCKSKREITTTKEEEKEVEEKNV